MSSLTEHEHSLREIELATHYLEQIVEEHGLPVQVEANRAVEEFLI